MRNAEEGVETLEALDTEDTFPGEDSPFGDLAPDGFGNGDDSRRPEPLLDPEERTRLRSRWDHVQAGFVDDPRRAVEQADLLVDKAVQRLAKSLSDERDRLARSWDRAGEPVTTEDLRQVVRHYRSFLDRLLSL